MTEAQPPQEPQVAQPVQTPPPDRKLVKPHRGTLVLVLGLLSLALLVCGGVALGITAWLLASPDLVSSPLVRPLGLLSVALLVCGGMVMGIIVWLLANSDLSEMQTGLMDHSGEGLTKAGKICGIISVALACAGTAAGLMMFLLAVARDA